MLINMFNIEYPINNSNNQIFLKFIVTFVPTFKDFRFIFSLVAVMDGYLSI